MCRFVRDGEPDIGEYRELADGTGIFIIEEYKTGILDEHEAGAELFHHLFPNEH